MREEKLSFKRKILRKVCAIEEKKIPDKLYLKMLYQVRMGKKLNLKNPHSFDEKMQWLKLYDRRPEYTMMADKYEVRKYVQDKLGERYLIPLLGVWDRVEDLSLIHI